MQTILDKKMKQKIMEKKIKAGSSAAIQLRYGGIRNVSFETKQTEIAWFFGKVNPPGGSRAFI